MTDAKSLFNLSTVPTRRSPDRSHCDIRRGPRLSSMRQRVAFGRKLNPQIHTNLMMTSSRRQFIKSSALQRRRLGLISAHESTLAPKPTLHTRSYRMRLRPTPKLAFRGWVQEGKRNFSLQTYKRSGFARTGHFNFALTIRRCWFWSIYACRNEQREDRGAQRSNSVDDDTDDR